MPGGNKAIRPEDGKQFSSDYQPLKNGRYPLILSEIIKDLKEAGYERVGRESVEQAYEALFGLDRAKLKEIAHDHTYPMIVQIVGKKMLDDDKAAEMLEKMLDRAHGKATNRSETKLTGAGENGEIVVFSIPDNGR